MHYFACKFSKKNSKMTPTSNISNEIMLAVDRSEIMPGIWQINGNEPLNHFQ